MNHENMKTPGKYPKPEPVKPMNKKNRKKMKQMKEGFTNPLDFGMKEQPPGEDFFVFAVTIDDPTNPNWDSGMSCLGTWEKAKELAGSFVTSWCADKKRLGKNIRVAMFQGDGAREYLLHSMKEEARYQKEVAAN